MNAVRKQLVHAAMIGGGLVAVALAAKPLAGCDALDFPINPLGVNRSPYGEVLAMAMQGPIDTFWHQGELAKLAPGGARATRCAVCDQDNECAHHASAADQSDSSEVRLPWNERFRGFLENLEVASTARTNPHLVSKALDLHIRRQVENKLRFAYRLDPAHYGNYNSYHFFLTEPQVGTRPILTPTAARLAHETIDYALAESRDPRPALTAAAAATNVIHLMFADRHSQAPMFTARQMRECLDLLDHCIARHLAIREQWLAAGHDGLLSPIRLMEMDERFRFVTRIRDAAVPAVERFVQEEYGENARPPNRLKKNYSKPGD
jgi:hypothetical protein